MQKLSRNILVAASAAAVMGAVVVGAVARYGAPQVDKEKMECAHMHVHDAMYNYSTAYDTAWRQSADTLKRHQRQKTGVGTSCVPAHRHANGFNRRCVTHRTYDEEPRINPRRQPDAQRNPRIL